jgi:hypothetical protein
MVQNFDRDGRYLLVSELMGESAWPDDLPATEPADALRSALRAEYAHASDAELTGAVETVLEAMSPAEALNFGAALDQIGKSANRLAADPALQQMAGTAAPIAGGAVGTVIGGPTGTDLGTQLGTLAAKALPAPASPAAPPGPPPATAQPAPSPLASPPVPPARSVPAAPSTAAPPGPPLAAALPVPASSVPTPSPLASPPSPPALSLPTTPPSVATPPGAAQPLDVPFTPGPVSPVAGGPAPRVAGGPASPVAGGSAAAAQGLVMTQQPDVLRALLAAALGRHGRQRVSGISVGQLLALLSQVFAQAASDADQLMYLHQDANVAEGVIAEVPHGAIRSLYADLIGADNSELAEAAIADNLELADELEFAEDASWEELD